MRTNRRCLRKVVWTVPFFCVAVGLSQTSSLQPLHAADAPADRTKLLGVYPREQPLILETASNAFAAFRDMSKVVCADDDAAELWDMATGKKLFSMKHSEVVIGVAISPDNKTLLTITAGRENPARLWNLENGRMLREYPSPFRGIGRNVAADKDGKSGWNPGVHSGNWRFPRRDYLPKTGFGFTAIAFSTNGLEFATGSEDGRIIVWDARTGKEMSRMVEEADRLQSVAFSRDGSRLLTSGRSGGVTIWNTNKRVLVKQFEKTEGRDSVYTLLPFSSDGKRFVFYSSRKQAICEVATGEDACHLPKSINVGRCIALLPGDQEILGQNGNVLEVFDVTTGKVRKRHTLQSGVHIGYAQPNFVYVQYSPSISAVMAVEVENDENTMHEDWTTISIVPLSEFKGPLQPTE